MDTSPPYTPENHSRRSTVFNCNPNFLRLKNENPEKYRNVVMMHLSVLVDLSFLEKFICIPKTTSEITLKQIFPMNTHKIFGVRLTDDILERINPLIDYLARTENCQVEGIFRISGSAERQRQLRKLLDSNKGGAPNVESSQFKLNDVATVLKTFLKELPEPLLLETNFNAYEQIAEMKDEAKQIQCLQLLNQLLPVENVTLLRNLLALLNKVASLEKQNRMSADNLSVIFTPHFLIPKQIETKSLHETVEKLKVIVVLMINNSSVMFDYPEKWIGDVIKYSEDIQVASGRKSVSRRFMKSRDEIDDDVILQASYTFADRKASMEAAQSTNTSKAIEELRMSVFEMPESARKAKLLKEIDKMLTPAPPSTPSTPNTCRMACSSLKNLILKRRNYDFVTSTPAKKLFYDEPENFEPAIICKSILLSEDESLK